MSEFLAAVGMVLFVGLALYAFPLIAGLPMTDGAILH